MRSSFNSLLLLLAFVVAGPVSARADLITLSISEQATGTLGGRLSPTSSLPSAAHSRRKCWHPVWQISLALMVQVFSLSTMKQIFHPLTLDLRSPSPSEASVRSLVRVSTSSTSFMQAILKISSYWARATQGDGLVCPQIRTS